MANALNILVYWCRYGIIVLSLLVKEYLKNNYIFKNCKAAFMFDYKVFYIK